MGKIAKIPSDKIFDFAKAWLEADPDPKTASDLKTFLDAGSSTKPEPSPELLELFSGQLSFGTAGLRAELGPGPQRMNRVLVQLVTKALVNTLNEDPTALKGEKGTPKIVLGYDGRHNSDIFACDAAGVIQDSGGEALLIDAPLPTPVLARAVLKQSADAGVMVTASHNPKLDNGYKAYWRDGGQIAPPDDNIVEQEFSKLLADYSNLDIKDYEKSNVVKNVVESNITEAALEDYLECIHKHLSPEVLPPKNLKIVYTPLHGVGKRVVERAFSKLGFPAPLVVSEQGEPDGDFPTADYPNPEEPGALDLALDLAKEKGADLILANDPDADRLSVSLPVVSSKSDSASSSEWQTLTGNEIGVLLADYCMERSDTSTSRMVATTCVSSQLLGKMAKARGIQYVETLTGFKWIARADKSETTDVDANLIFGYEEALGYAVLPQQVRDKDGISAAVAFLNLYSQLAEQGKTPLDRLRELDAEFGIHLTSSASIRYDGTDSAQAAGAMARLRSQLPTKIGESTIVNILDYADARSGVSQRPSNMLTFYLENESRVVVRPSGTEPKLKVYVELVERDIKKRKTTQTELNSLTNAAAQLVASGQNSTI